MRIIFYIILFMSQSIFLYASSGSVMFSADDNISLYNKSIRSADKENFINREISSEVSFNEEITALWEHHSETEIHSAGLLSDFSNAGCFVSPLNAFCSPESIEFFNSLRSRLAEIIIKNKIKGRLTNSSILAGKILLEMEDILISPLTSGERDLAVMTEKIDLQDDVISNSGVLNGNIPEPEFAALPQIIVFLNSPVYKNRPGKCVKRVLYSILKYAICGNNIFDREFADFYRLFLYVRDNSGNRKKNNLTLSIPFFCSVQSLYNSTRYINTLTTFFIIHQSEVYL